MIFVYKKWNDFCNKLSRNNMTGIPAIEYLNSTSEDKRFILKHDVETDVLKAHRLAEIEHKYGHRGSYYVQAYLLDNERNINLLKQMQNMGHEITYHYDVLDSNKGDIEKALLEFQSNVEKFEKSGFEVVTVCQHGNPVLERIGYNSNRDFFRSDKVQKKYPAMTDIMVDFPDKTGTEYDYYSDAGRKFKLIYDPINNDIVNSDDKNIEFKNLDTVFNVVCASEKNIIISTHPHRWTASALEYILKTAVFKVVKTVAKMMVKIPGVKKFMSRYYYLAKKI